MTTNKIFITFLFIFCISWTYAQQENIDNEKKLKELAIEIPSLNDTISMSISEWSLQEFLRGVATYSKLNFEIATNIDNKITVNFVSVRIVDILLFVCRQYNLQISNLGSIISINKCPPIYPDDSNEIVYVKETNTLSIDIKQKKLTEVIRKIIVASGKNLVPEAGLEEIPLTAFIQAMPFETAIEKLAFANNLIVKTQSDGIIIISKNPQKNTVINSNDVYISRNQQNNQNSYAGEYQMEITIEKGDSISVFAFNAPLENIITESCRKLGKSYYLNDKIEGTKIFNTKNLPFDLFIHQVLDATMYTCVKKGNTYFFGLRSQSNMKVSKVIMLQNRTVKNIKEVLPKYIISEIEMSEFVEQNSLVIAGATDKVDIAERFIISIDKPIPVILIEVIMIDMKKSFNISTGIEAGITDKQIDTKGVIFPGLDVQLSSNAINDVLKSFKGIDVKNIGLKPNIYLTLQAMENQGILDIRSTPKLSTLNGHEAKLSIGKTEYYEEESSNIVGNVGTTVSTYKTYKPVEAELAITITPIISGNNEVTLDIEVKQSDFTERIKTTAPPGVVRREFKSLIKVQNNETVILGGLEEDSKSETAKGVPLLSKIPIIKWLFSSRNRTNSKNKLNVFIKTTIL